MTQRPTLVVSAEADKDIDDAAICIAERRPASALGFFSSVANASNFFARIRAPASFEIDTELLGSKFANRV